MRRWSTPVAVHVGGLLAGFAVILVVARDQWFFGDDWSVLVLRNDGNLLAPHVGHWNLVPALVFRLIRDTLGMSSYLPYLIPAVLAHLVVVHLSWRLLRRVGAGDWPATLAALVLTVLGGAAENLLWAFQVGFMGALAVGLAVVTILDTRPLRAGPAVAAALLAVVAPMLSGTALPVLVVAGVVAIVRHGVARAVVVLGPAAVVYVAWYALFVIGRPGAGLGVSSPGELAPAALFAAAMLAAGPGRALPFIGLGVLPAAGAAVWWFATVRRGATGPALPAYALAVGAVVFAVVTAWSRVDSGLTAAGSQRYAYATIVLLLPSIVLATLALVHRLPVLRIPVVVVVLALAVFNALLLVAEADAQAAREAQSRARIEAAIERLRADPSSATDESVDPQWAPDLRGTDLRDLVEAGALGRPR